MVSRQVLVKIPTSEAISAVRSTSNGVHEGQVQIIKLPSGTCPRVSTRLMVDDGTTREIDEDNLLIWQKKEKENSTSRFEDEWTEN